MLANGHDTVMFKYLFCQEFIYEQRKSYTIMALSCCSKMLCAGKHCEVLFTTGNDEGKINGLATWYNALNLILAALLYRVTRFPFQLLQVALVL